MPPVSARPNSLCLFCALATRPRPRPRLQTNRLVPQIEPTTTTRSRTNSSSRRPPTKAFFAGPKKPPVPNTATIVQEQLKKLKNEIEQPEFRGSLQLSKDKFDSEWVTFERSISLWVGKRTAELDKLAHDAARGKKTLRQRLRYLFYAHTFGSRFTSAELENQKEVANLRYPAEWYPATRQIQRTVHLHVGPTNSGKTYHALKRLEEADKGIYLGPLRLLAHEVYTRLNAKGKKCALVTGEEQRLPDGLQGEKPKMFSCTVEMAPLNNPFDVAVIDEIQMINHSERGWAWTQAFLGLQAREIHLCGEARTVSLIRELAALVGDKVKVHEYKRLTPLEVAPKSLKGNLDRLQKGDCIVAFTIIGIHALRREIERRTGKKCAIVYGSLPPETRAQQARLFNDPDNDYDYLVASDAIGMGLNLAIKRVILESTIKSNGVQNVPLEISDVKQIAGRAGRYRTAHQAVTTDEQNAIADGATGPAIGLEGKPKRTPETTVGFVTTLDDIDHPYLVAKMSQEPPKIKSAGLFPPSIIVDRFAKYFPPGTPFSYIMLRLHEIVEIHPRFHLCALNDQLAIADCIHTIKNLSIHDRITICAAPMNMKETADQDFLHELALCIADGKSGNLLDLDTLALEIMDEEPCSKREYLYRLEQLHKRLVCYLWLSYRFPNVLTTRSLAEHAKKVVETQIEYTLTQFSFTESQRQQLLRHQRHKMQQDLHEQSKAKKQFIPAPPSMPREAQDIVNDTRALNESAPHPDDIDEYPEAPISEDEISQTPERLRSNA